jgi:hypothetical protein
LRKPGTAADRGDRRQVRHTAVLAALDLADALENLLAEVAPP